jgi:hypothetical protein
MFRMKLVFVLFFIIISAALHAQFPNLPSNLSNLKAADVTQEQLIQIGRYMQTNNMNYQQAYDLLIARGMNAGEAVALRERLEKAAATRTSDTDNSTSSRNESSNATTGERRLSDTTNKTIEVLNPKKIFGLEIFNNGVLSFEPNINIATPAGYIIGPNDEININIFGYQEAKYSLKVGPEEILIFLMSV